MPVSPEENGNDEEDGQGNRENEGQQNEEESRNNAVGRRARVISSPEEPTRKQRKGPR